MKENTKISDLRDKDLIGEFMRYIDSSGLYNININRYEAADSLLTYPKGTEYAEENFLIVDGWNSIEELNEWLNDNYGEILEEETRYSYNGDRYFTNWIDYLTQKMWGFSDEYAICDDCGKAFKTSPDGYSPSPYWIGDGFIICEDCVKNNYKEDYLESLLNNPKKANTILSEKELLELGYEKVSEFENGWYGTCDDPEEILETAMRENPENDYLFSIKENQPFCVIFELWKK